jgi:hypothetical protein
MYEYQEHKKRKDNTISNFNFIYIYIAFQFLIDSNRMLYNIPDKIEMWINISNMQKHAK